MTTLSGLLKTAGFLITGATRARAAHAWLEFAVRQEGTATRYRQRAIFIPSGLRGRLYWVFVSPFHRFIFPAMAKNIEKAARARPKSH